MLLGTILYVVVLILLFIVPIWLIFQKAGQPGWASIIPIYNVIVLLNVVNKPWWWLLLMLIPVVNIVLLIIVYHRLSLSFGKGAGFTVGIIFLPFIFLPILGYGSAAWKKLED